MVEFLNLDTIAVIESPGSPRIGLNEICSVPGILRCDDLIHQFH